MRPARACIGALAALLEAPLVVRGATLGPRDAIVVLGAPLVRDLLSAPLVERVDAAAALWHAGGAPRVVTTGGITGGATRAEADVMAEALRARGVPDVLVEARARTTAENARFSAALLAPHGARAVWIVTHAFHGRRARRLFRAAGLDAEIWPVAGGIASRDRARAARWAVREYAAWAKLLVLRRDR